MSVASVRSGEWMLQRSGLHECQTAKPLPTLPNRSSVSPLPATTAILRGGNVIQARVSHRHVRNDHASAAAHHIAYGQRA